MDRRQKKTVDAIFNAFTQLLKNKSYAKITIQNIIDKADIGRSTFYSHFETKDELVKSLCKKLFKHIEKSLSDKNHTHELKLREGETNSIFCHILQHLKEDDNKILFLLSREHNEFFCG